MQVELLGARSEPFSFTVKPRVIVRLFLVVAICGLSLTAHASFTSVVVPSYGTESTASLPGQEIQSTTFDSVVSTLCCDGAKFSNPPGTHERYVTEFKATGYAGPDALRGTAYAYASRTVATVVNLRVETDQDIVFSFDPFTPADLAIEVNLDAALSAVFVYTGDGGSGLIHASTAVIGNIYTDEALTQQVSSVRALSSVHQFVFNKDSDNLEVVAEDLELNFWVRNGDPVKVVTEMSVRAFGTKNTFLGTSGGVTAFGNRSLDFNPESFFDILTPGVTANSVSLGLVNNQLVNFLPIPEPTALTIFGLGLAGLGLMRRPQR